MKKNLLLLILVFTLSMSFIANAQVPARVGWWKFDDPTNLVKAEIGAPLLLSGVHQSVDGPVTGNKAVQIGPGNYYVMTHGIKPNGGGAMVNEYSLQFDFSIPEGGKYHAFFQTDPTNSGDADLFANSSSNSVGVAATGYSSKGLLTNTWYRMVVTVKNGEFYKIYIDGALWLDGVVQPVDGRFGLSDVLLLFADDDGEDGTINCSEVGIWNIALNVDQVTQLGGVLGIRVPERKKVGWWKFDDPTNLLKAEIGKPLVLVGTQQSVNGPLTGDKATKIDVGSYLKMTHGISSNGGGSLVNEYSIQMDFSVPETGKWHSFFQTDQTNASDADLFTNTSNAIGTSATTYSANTISANTWYRMVISVKDGEFFKVYLNGELWLDAAGQSIDGRFGLSNVLLLFADDDGEDGTIICADLSIYEVALNADEVTALGTDPTNKIPERVGWWKFDDPKNLGKATLGYNLSSSGTAITSVPGPTSTNNAAEVGLGSYFSMTHGIYSNGGGLMVNEYSLQIDFSIPEAGKWHAFFQTDQANASDADLFTNKSNAIGTAATTYTTKTISANTWYRMIITVKNGTFFKIYLNGELWLDAAGQMVDGRFALSNELLLFADEDGDDGLIDCSEVSIWEVALNADQVALLGNASTVITGIQEKINGNESDLGQNYPNPFSNSTIFPYQIQKAGKVSFRIIDLAGKEIRMINEGIKSSGKYNLEINSEKLKNGIYFLQMKSDQSTITRKMVVAQ